MRTFVSLCVVLLLMAGATAAQDAPPSPEPVGTVSQMMVDMIHPAANAIMLSIFRGGPQSDAEWAALRSSAMTLAESGNLLMLPDRAWDQGDWMRDAKLLVDAGAAAYAAAQARNADALAGVPDRIDASCLACHRHYRGDVFPLQ